MTCRASLSFSARLSTVPTASPLYCTLPPSVRPVTGSLKTTWYCRQLRDEEKLLAHNANSKTKTKVARLKAPIST